MASAASGLMIDRSSKAFDLGSEEVMCAYHEFSQGSADGVISDPANGKDFSKDFQKSRMTSYSPAAVNNQLDEIRCGDTYYSMLEKCMKRHTDDIMRVLEGISSRLSHLELYCYNVDKSIGEMRLDLGRDYEETEMKLQSLEKHLGEVSHSVQILRDKQELAETQKELAKLQRVQVELSSPHARRSDAEQRSTSPASEDTFEVQNPHLAIVLHHQVAPQQQQLPPTRPVEIPQPIAPSQSAQQHTTQPQHFYVASSPYQVQVQASQGQYLRTDAQYQNPQPLQQDFNLVRLQPVSQSPPQVQQFIQTQSQPQQPQYMMSTQQSIQQPPTHAQSRPQSASGYPSNQPNQSVLQAPQEAIHASFSNMPQHLVVTRAEVMPNGYSGKPMPQQHHPPTQMKANFGSMCGDIYTTVGPQPPHLSFTPATAAAYMMCGNEQQMRRQPTPQPQFPQSYPPSAASLQHPQQVSVLRNPNQPQFSRSHPYNDLIDKFANMGFVPDHVISVIQNMVENGQPVDSNAVLNKLNVHSSSTHRPWTG